MDLFPFKNCLAHKQSVYISNDTEAYRPCCWFQTGIKANNLQDYQQQLSKLDIAKNCAHCIKQEASGATWSHRFLFNNPKEFVLGVCFDNVCNLKCVTCSPVYSSQLIGEWDDLGLFKDITEKKHFIRLSKQAPEKFDFIIDVLKNSEFDSLKVEIFGGEPLINPTVFKFIDWLAEQTYASQTTLSITSNASTYTEKIIEYSQKFKCIALQLSIDGTEKTFEYLRFGNVWDNSVQIINQYYNLLDTMPNFTLAFNYTLSWMNSLHFVKFYNWAIVNYPNIHLHLTKLEGPDYYSVNILSKEHRQQIVNYVDKNIIKDNVNNSYGKLYDLYKQSMIIKNYDMFNEKMYSTAKRILQEKDLVRNTDYKTILHSIMGLIENATT